MSSDGPGLWGALAEGVGELERMLARAGQGVGLVGSLVAAYVALFVSTPLGFPLFCLTVSAFSWYTLAHALLAQGVRPDLVRVGTALVELAVPLSALLVAWQTQGAEYALGSWVPPQLWCVFLTASILRLDPRIPALMGVLGAASYAAAWALLLRPSLVQHDLLLYRDEMQAVRIGSLLLIGVAGSGAVLGLRRVVDRAAAELRARELFGKYRLGPLIASGGMGRVLHATYCPEGGFERRVAVKLVHPHLAQDPALVERFRQEAAIGARLHHPNIVATLDFGRVGDTCFLAMEYVDGRPLSDLVRERRAAGQPWSPSLVAFLGRQLAEGLEHAHEHATDDAGRPLRVVHRDLSPANLLVDRSGRVKITDFGVAKALGDTTRAQTEQLVGKPGYVAPEALRGLGVDARADLWSLGVILWELLAGERLFARDSEASALFAVMEGVIPPLVAVRKDLDPGWQALLDGLLARDRERRTPTARAVKDALEDLLRREGTPPPAELAALTTPEADGDELPLDATEDASRSS